MIEVLSTREMAEMLQTHCMGLSDNGKTCDDCKAEPNEKGACYGFGASEKDIEGNFRKVFGELHVKLSGLEAKHDHGKLRLSLVPRGIVEAVATIREYGTEKYGDPENWKNVSDERYWDAALRHMEAARNDMHAKDPESGCEHLWHIACNLAFIIAREEK